MTKRLNIVTALVIAFLLLAFTSSAQAQATAPSIALAGGSYTGVQYGVKITSANGGTNIIACTIDGTTPATNGLGTSAANDGHSFTMQNPGWFPIAASETLICVAGTSLLADSTTTTRIYTINAPTKTDANTEGAQCQATTNACAGYGFPAVFPARFRIWDCASPFFSETPAQQGSNCDWASIESNPATPGVYAWTAMDNWLDAIHAQRIVNPNFTAAYTFGMIPHTQVITGIPGGTTGFAVTGVTAFTSTTLTLSGTFPTNIQYLYVTLSGMNVANNNISIGSGGTGQAAVSSCSPNCATPTTVTVTTAGGIYSTEGPSTGTLKVVPGPKGMSIHPDDLPLQGGTTNWNGTPPSPGCSPSFHNFVAALVAHCSAAAHCFSKEVDVIESWNEPNNNFFWNPNLNSLPQITQMLECELPTIRNVMDGTAGTKKVVIQGVATTASAPVTSQYEGWEVTNGHLTDIVDYHHYFAGAVPSVAPETVTSVESNMLATRASNLGFAGIPVRATEVGFQATTPPYGCTLGSPWIATDCYGQGPRFHLISGGLGIQGVDWYNWAPNCLKVTTGGAFGTGCAGTYSQFMTLLNGGTFTGACTNSGVSPNIIYQCPFTGPSGKTSLWVWQYCPNDGNYATSVVAGTPFTVPGGYTNYRDLNGSNTLVAGGTVTVTVTPILFEQTTQNQQPAAPILSILE